MIEFFWQKIKRISFSKIIFLHFILVSLQLKLNLICFNILNGNLYIFLILFRVFLRGGKAMNSRKLFFHLILFCFRWFLEFFILVLFWIFLLNIIIVCYGHVADLRLHLWSAEINVEWDVFLLVMLILSRRLLTCHNIFCVKDKWNKFKVFFWKDFLIDFWLENDSWFCYWEHALPGGQKWGIEDRWLTYKVFAEITNKQTNDFLPSLKSKNLQLTKVFHFPHTCHLIILFLGSLTTLFLIVNIILQL